VFSKQHPKVSHSYFLLQHTRAGDICHTHSADYVKKQFPRYSLSFVYDEATNTSVT